MVDPRYAALGIDMEEQEKAVESNVDGYTKLNEGSKCYFCDSHAKYNHYIPTKSAVKIKGSHGEMVSIKVCVKCLGRCNRMLNIPLQELTEYQDRLNHKEKKVKPLMKLSKDHLSVISKTHGDLNVIEIEEIMGRYMVTVE